jgi:hypothetical protein
MSRLFRVRMNSASEQADSARQKEEEEEKKLGGI